MSDSIIQSGEKVFVIHRQQFSGDSRRHFFGVVDSSSGLLARVTGRVFGVDSRTNQFVPRDRSRTRIIPLNSSGIIVNVIPPEVDIDQIKYSSIAGGQLHITDGSSWHLDLNPT